MTLYVFFFLALTSMKAETHQPETKALLTAFSCNVCVTVLPLALHQLCVAVHLPVNLLGPFGYRVFRSDEVGQLNLPPEASCLHSEMGNSRERGSLSVPSTLG